MSLASLDPAAFLHLHRESLLDEGVECGTWDEELLEAALTYPVTEASLTVADVAAIAAAYAIGILRYRPFAVGNARAAFLAMGLFLYSNEWRLDASQEQAAAALRRAACGEMGEDDLANWIRRHL